MDYRVRGFADVTAVRMLGIERNDHPIDEIARMFRAHRATIGRRLKRARTKIVRTIETRLRLESGAAKQELRNTIPELAKELQFDWSRALGNEKQRP